MVERLIGCQRGKFENAATRSYGDQEKNKNESKAPCRSS